MDSFRSDVRNALLEGVMSNPNPIYEIHTVQKGDSLWKIAAAKLGNGSRYNEIKEINGLKSDILLPGQQLKIPK
jgi:LysM repeat protein